MLTENEVMQYLGIGRSGLERLIKSGKLTAFRVGGSYLRFHKEEVTALRSGRKFVPPDRLGRKWQDKVRDFVQFYSFYVVSSFVIMLLIAVFFRYQ